VSQEAIQEMLAAYRATLPAGSPRRSAPWVAEGFGDGPELADRLGDLVLAGVKTATCSALWEWEAAGDPLPRAGLLTVVLEGGGRPLGISETTEVRILPYDRVDEDFAREETAPWPAWDAGPGRICPWLASASAWCTRSGSSSRLRAPALAPLRRTGATCARGRPAWTGRAP
jgi:uncharacterized protein YhfF